MHYEKDRRMLLKDPVDDGILSFARTTVGSTAEGSAAAPS